MHRIKAAWIIGAIGRGGVITVCRNATEFVAQDKNFEVSLVAINTCLPGFVAPAGVKVEILNLPFSVLPATKGFMQWLNKNPQDVLFFNDASYAEPSWPFIPQYIALVPVLHDVARGWRKNIIKYYKSWDMVVTVSEFVKNELIKDLPHCADRIRIVYNGTRYPEMPVRRRNAHNEGRLQLVYAGSTDPFKGVFDIPYIVAALEKENIPYDLYILSVPDEIVKKKISREIKNGKLIWEGYLTHDVCMNRFSQSDILIMPSRAEPFGMVTIEAMAMGCVPVAYDLPSGSREIIINGQTGILVPPSSPRNIAQAIAGFYYDRAMLLEMSRKAMEDIRKRFSAEKMAEGYIKIAKETINSCARNLLLRKEFNVNEIEQPTRPLWINLLPSKIKEKLKVLVCKNIIFSAWMRRMRN